MNLFTHLSADDCLEHKSSGILAQESFQNVLSHYRSKNIGYNTIIDKIGFQPLTRIDVMELRTCLFDYYMFGLKEVNKP
jgi:hypothetical protein